MKAIKLISILILFSNTVLSQISGVYSLNNADAKDIICDVYLYQTGVYEIILEEKETDDLIFNLLMSYGNYKLHNNELVLYDDFNGFKMYFKFDKDFIIPKKTFHFLSDNKLIKSSFQIWDKPSFTKAAFETLSQTKTEFNRSNKVENLLNCGIYVNEQGFSLYILQNKEYKLEFKNIILSKGMWSRDRNELVLFDITLKHKFFILIGEKVLISKLFPGEYTGFTFNKK
jgi:hypothetical protein